jgi:hypothetical protein
VDIGGIGDGGDTLAECLTYINRWPSRTRGPRGALAASRSSSCRRRADSPSTQTPARIDGHVDAAFADEIINLLQDPDALLLDI